MKNESLETTPRYDVDLTNCDREPIHLLGGVQKLRLPNRDVCGFHD